MKILRHLFLCTLLLGLPLAGLADARQDFEKAYTIYRKHFDAGEWAQALTAAEDAYYLGLKIFGNADINTANLAFNYGRLLNRFERYDKASPLLHKALRGMEDYHGQDSKALVDPLIELGKATWGHDRKAALAYFDRATLLANKRDAMTQAMDNMDIGMFLSRTSNTADAQRFLESAYGQLRNLVGEQDERTAIVRMALGSIALAKGDYAKALDMLNASLKVFAARPEDRHLQIATHAYLVQGLEALGHHRQATTHCLAVSRLTDAATPVLLSAVQPEYPKAAAKAPSGYVDVRFTVDAEGFVHDARVTASTAKILEAPALAAVRKFRYAPRQEDGKPVAAKDFHTRVSFGIEGKS